MAVTWKQIHALLKEQNELLSEVLSRSGFSAVFKSSQPSQSLSAVENLLSGLALETTLSSLNGKDFSTETTLSALKTAFDAVDFSTETTLESMRQKQVDIWNDTDAIRIATQASAVDLSALEILLAESGGFKVTELLASIKANTSDIESRVDGLEAQNATQITALNDINSELDSIDDNWNLLSVNSIAMVATAANTLNNATTGRQDAMIVDLAAIEVLLIAQAVLIASTNTKLDTIETTVNGIETDLAKINGGGGGYAMLELDSGSPANSHDFSEGIAHLSALSISTDDTVLRTVDLWMTNDAESLQVFLGSVQVQSTQSPYSMDDLGLTWMMGMLFSSTTRLYADATTITAAKVIDIHINSRGLRNS